MIYLNFSIIMGLKGYLILILLKDSIDLVGVDLFSGELSLLLRTAWVEQGG